MCREGPPIRGSLNRKGVVTQAAIPSEQTLQIPGDLPKHEAERDPLTWVSAQEGWAISGCQSRQAGALHAWRSTWAWNRGGLDIP